MNHLENVRDFRFLNPKNPKHRKLWVWLVYQAMAGELQVKLEGVFLDDNEIPPEKTGGVDLKETLREVGVINIELAKIWVTMYKHFLYDPEIIGIDSHWEDKQDFDRPTIPWDFEITHVPYIRYFMAELTPYYIYHLKSLDGYSPETQRAAYSLNLLMQILIRNGHKDFDEFFDEWDDESIDDLLNILIEQCIALPWNQDGSVGAGVRTEHLETLLQELGLEGEVAIVTIDGQDYIYYPDMPWLEGDDMTRPKRPKKRM